MHQCEELKAAETADRNYRRSVIIFAVLVLAALALKAPLLSLWPVHQDEFHYLSMVYTYERGEMTTPFESFHVHFFGWLSAVGQNEVTQIIAARVVMYFLLLGTCFYLFRTARHFLGAAAAMFSLLCYLCFLFTVSNGASFRHDTLAGFFIVFALYHFIVHRDSALSNVLAGVAMAVALLFTIKAAIFLPVFAVWFLSRLLLCGGRSRYLIRIACFAGALIVGFIALYKLHAATLGHSAAGNGSGFLSGSYSTFITFGQLFPARDWIIQTLVVDFFVWFLFLVGLIVYLVDLAQRRYARNQSKTLLLVLLIPLCSLVVYRNACPYFFVFLMPAATLFCGYAFERLVSTLKNDKRIMIPVLSAFLGLIVFAEVVPHLPRYLRSEAKLTLLQHDTLKTIHRMFPEPVPYVDKCSMVASYPKIGFFMSAAGMRNYLRRNKPIMGRLLAEKKPIFLLANFFMLDLHSDAAPRSAAGQALLATDWTVLKSYFIHHWGQVWVVGKQFNLSPAVQQQHFEIIAPGLYTVESQTDIIIDGTSYHNGDVVRLEEGHHTIEAGRATTTIRLRGGDHLYRPDSEPEETNLLGPFL
jgi:hypothetical protein